MKLALFADIHSNLEAITACLAHAQALGVDRYAFLGDLVGYGADPVAVLDLIEQHAANGAVVVLSLYTSPSPRDKRQSRIPSSA
jgi:predicted phosphodiesterase